MINDLQDLKKLLGIVPEAVGLNDIDRLGDGATPWERAVEGLATEAGRTMEVWGGETDRGRVEAMIVRAYLLRDYGAAMLLKPAEVGNKDIRVRRDKRTPADIDQMITDLLTSARTLLTGSQPDIGTGVA